MAAYSELKTERFDSLLFLYTQSSSKVVDICTSLKAILALSIKERKKKRKKEKKGKKRKKIHLGVLRETEMLGCW